MAIKAVLFCASVILVQSIAGQACGRISIPQPSCGSSVTISNNGGSLIVTSISPIPPTGIAVSSDLDLRGDLDVSGSLPFLAGVGFSADLPTSGSGTVDYSCGSTSDVTITSVTGGGGLGGCSCGK